MRVKKRTAKQILALLAAVSFILSLFLPAAVSGESYNDSWVYDYGNMTGRNNGTKYVVPSLFKNDIPFSNYKRFPLVVQDDIEYIPLEMFTGFSGVEVKTNLKSDNFYIKNNDNLKTISFNVETSMALTDDKKTQTLVTKLFYNTRYVPATETAYALGLGCETYMSIEEGVYALRLTDGREKHTFSEVVKMYSPVKRESGSEPIIGIDDEPNIIIPDNAGKENNTGNVENNDSPQTVVPDIGSRTICVSFDAASLNRNTETLLNTLQGSGITATFFCTGKGMMKNPDIVRRMLIDGHTVGILIEANDSIENIKSEYSDSLETYQMITKNTTHLARFYGGSNLTRAIDKDTFSEFIVSNEICLWDYNIGARSSSGAGMYSEIYAALYNIKSTKVVIKMNSGAEAAKAVRSLASFVNSKSQLAFSQITDADTEMSFR